MQQRHTMHLRSFVRLSRLRGFTLVELMIVVVIVAILAGIAVPSYMSSVRKTRRADAKTALLDLAGREERYLTTNPAGYSTVPADLGYPGVRGRQSGGHRPVLLHLLRVRDSGGGREPVRAQHACRPLVRDHRDTDARHYPGHRYAVRDFLGRLRRRTVRHRHAAAGQLLDPVENQLSLLFNSIDFIVNLNS